ncbi:hypothetical protein JCM11641_006340, partial [Rhodosporidiobolus odoratus]
VPRSPSPNANDYIARKNTARLATNLPSLVFNANFQFDSTLYPFVLTELSSFDAFLSYFNISFSDPDARSTAERKIASLRQITSVASYAAEFQAFCFDLNDTPHRIATMFYSNLKPAIKDKVHRRGKPTDLTSMIALAVQVDNHLQERELERKEEALARPRTFPRSTTSFSLQPDPTRAPRPATASPSLSRIATTTSPSTSATRLTQADRDYRYNNRLCLYCGGSEHLIAACPVRPERPSIAATTPPPAAPSETFPDKLATEEKD